MRKTFLSGDVISGALLGALGVYIVVEARKWTYLAADGPGPGFFPTWYGVGMIVLSLALIVTAAMKPRSRADQDAVDPAARWRALGTWAAFVAAALLLKPLGFVLSFALLTFFVVAAVFRRPLTTAAITAVCAALTFHLTFPVVLSVPLPVGWFGF